LVANFSSREVAAAIALLAVAVVVAGVLIANDQHSAPTKCNDYYAC
jgi:hypothetical protein